MPKKTEYKIVPDQENGSERELQLKYGYGVRHIQLALMLLCLTVNIIGRGHMGVSIVAMTDTPKNYTNVSDIVLNVTKANNTEDLMNTLEEQYLEDHISTRNFSIEMLPSLNVTKRSHNTFQWQKSVQEMVLNSFFLGYSVMMFPMGLVCQRYGGKLPLQIALLINGMVSVMTPWLTSWGGWKAVCVCRILQGFSQAGTYPSVQTQLARWAPVNELATLSSYVYTGGLIGTVVAYQAAGILGESSWGWPSTFYGFGVISLTCFILLTIFGVSSPAEHKSITEEEKKYILGSSKDGSPRVWLKFYLLVLVYVPIMMLPQLEHSLQFTKLSIDVRLTSWVATKKLKTPWRAMATSKPLWGVIIAQIGSNASFVFFFNQVPSYIHNILGINVKNSGLLSSLPYIASFFTSIAYGRISDYCTNNNIISRKNARRIFNTIALCGLAVALICASYTNNIAVAVTCLVVAMATHVAVHASWMVNHIDLSPNFSGTMIASSSTLGMVFLLSTPVIISYVVTDTTNVIQWRIMFFIIAGFCFLTNAIFVVLVSTDIQPWNYPDFNEKCSENPKDVTVNGDETELKK